TAAKSSQPTEAGGSAAPQDDSRVKASPLARKIAKEKGIRLGEVKGSGDGGRVIKKDVESYTPSAKAETTPAAAQPAAREATAATVSIPQFVGEERYTEKSVTQMRKTISRRLSETFVIPHFYLT